MAQQLGTELGKPCDLSPIPGIFIKVEELTPRRVNSSAHTLWHAHALIIKF